MVQGHRLPPLRSHPSAEILDAPEEAEAPAIWNGYLWPGEITILAADAKEGKSTLVFALMEALETGNDFLGQPTMTTKVLYLSEESRSTIRRKLQAFDLGRRAMSAEFITTQDNWPKRSFEQVMLDTCARAKVIGAKLLVIDTLGYWGGLVGDEEQSAGAVNALLAHVLNAKAQGCAILLLVHNRKSGGDLVARIRGSSAFGANADTIIGMEIDGEAGTKNRLSRRRRIEAVGRHQSPPTLIAELPEAPGARYAMVGESRGEVREHDDQDVILRHLPGPAEGGWTWKEIASATGLPLRRVRQAVTAMQDRVERLGGGKSRIDPYRFRRRVEG